MSDPEFIERWKCWGWNAWWVNRTGRKNKRCIATPNSGDAAMTRSKPFCKAQSFHGRLGLASCARLASRDGYCGIHHPDSIAKRKAKSDAFYTAKIQASDRKFVETREKTRRANAYPKLIAELRRLRDVVNAVDAELIDGVLYDAERE